MAISFRRQKMISYSSATATVLQIFAEHATTEDDRVLVAWMILQRIAEDIENMKSNVEVRADSALTERESVKSDLSLFNDRLKEWVVQHKSLLRNGELTISFLHAYHELTLLGALKIDFAFCRAKLHELALYVDHDVENLSLPSLFQKRPTNYAGSTTVPINATYVRALLSFVADCHLILDATLETPIEKLRCCPILTFFRIAYAFRALAMLRSRASDSRNSISNIVDDESLRWEYYVEATGTHMEAVCDDGTYLVPAMILRIRDTFRKRYFRSATEPKPLDTQEFNVVTHIESDSYHSSTQIQGLNLPRSIDREETNRPRDLTESVDAQDWYDSSFDFDIPMVDDLLAFDFGADRDDFSRLS